MIRFLFKGILRDKNRSLLPIIIISIGVLLTIFLSGFLKGIMGDIVDQNARFQTGHVKVMTKAYAENADQMPNDLALLDVNELVVSLKNEFRDYDWVKRTLFGGIIDVPNDSGTSRAQGPAMGIAIEIYSEQSLEVERLSIPSSIIKGTLPTKKGEVLIGVKFANKMNLKIGDEITFMGSTMNGSMTFSNFIISGIVRFGMSNMDNGTFIIDIADAQQLLDMDDGASEILGFAKDGVYYDEQAKEITDKFNSKYASNKDEFDPIMERLKEQNNMASYLNYVESFSSLFVIIFVIVMSIVLWNTGLIGGLRRYQEFGIRLALGEEKKHIYATLVYEAVLIGTIGSIIGSILGITATLILQKVGIDISGMMQGGSMMMPSEIRAKFTSDMYYIGFIPGLFAMVLGNMLSGIGIYKRETATLFKELEI